jgi:thiol-disulfide isomerase/thioredoxin
LAEYETDLECSENSTSGGKDMKRILLKYGLALVSLVGIILSTSCTSQASPPTATTPVTSVFWMNIELTDVVTGGTFKISDFRNKPILLESFAVWCPVCLRQQQEIAQLHSSEGDSIIHISLGIDPNEDEAKVREHVQSNGLDWYFAVSPVELSQALIDEFGFEVVAAPAAPVILICPDQSARLLEIGVKSADKLLTEITKGCN